ncbi:G patch domain-containing protein 1 homolog [Diprion similis]|uniref:G patch domain-containing protein 1 homolog n=1 Tax=Diprion similis TaxID=362088 RepID=UPI001EF7D10B|nr:G patch domain-containing protein 1 homolog [Diprion similis]
MLDSDDENYVIFGTALDPLDEDNFPRKKPMTIEDQYACDEQGRRRFHGAFTGGFSAGYFNTVGTRDGWRPQQFKSSRSSKAESKAQTPQDFMDDEDTGQFGIAPTAIRTTADYASHESKGTKRERTKFSEDGPIPGTPVLQEILKPVKDTVGVKLLKQMGWKPGQGVGPRLSKKEKAKIKQHNDKTRVHGCSLPPRQEQMMETDSGGSDEEDSNITFAPDDYEPFRCNPKDNFFGIGYTGLEKRPILSQHISLFEPSSFQLQEKNKKLSIRGQAFGVGAFEAEDEDIYSREDMSQYDFSLEPKSRQKSRWTHEKPETSQSKCIEGFVPAKNRLEARKTFKLPDLPKGFNPVHIIRKSRFEPTIESTSLENARRKGLGRHDLRVEDRARIINDPNPISLVLSSKVGSGSTNEKNPSNSCLLPCGVDKKRIQPVSEIAQNEKCSDQEQTPKKPSVISNIITKTLNLHGKEQAARNLERPANTVGNNNKDTKLGNAGSTTANKNSWLEVLNTKSFVKGGTENLSLIKEPNVKCSQDAQDEKLLANPRNEAEDKGMSDDSRSSVFKPFAGDLDKQKRYEKFLEFSRDGEKNRLSDIQPLSMTEWERDHERVEFDQAARLYKPLTGSMSDRFVSGKHQDSLNSLVAVDLGEDTDVQLKEMAAKKMFGKMTRQRSEWRPASILCKRFNIAEPVTGCAQPETAKKSTFSIFDYLEESVHNSSTFQSVSDVAVRIKSQNLESGSNLEDRKTGFSESYQTVKSMNNSAMVVCDNMDKNKTSAKERNFEAKYEKIFGKNVNSSVVVGKDNSVDLSSNVQSVDQPAVCLPCVESNLDFDQNRNFAGSSSSSDRTDQVDNIVDKEMEKKDLFKAIFVSSSEDSDSEREEELDDDKFKSVLIGKNPGELNVQRNTSPPRGIFANLDLDSLNDVGVKNNKINFIEHKSSTIICKGEEMPGASCPNRNSGSSDNTTMENITNYATSAEGTAESSSQILADMYGPVLPARQQKYLNNAQSETISQVPIQKHVFKSVVVPVTKPDIVVHGEWIEKKKSKKSKKEEKKHKHKEHKKHKHKKKKK